MENSCISTHKRLISASTLLFDSIVDEILSHTCRYNRFLASKQLLSVNAPILVSRCHSDRSIPLLHGDCLWIGVDECRQAVAEQGLVINHPGGRLPKY